MAEEPKKFDYWKLVALIGIPAAMAATFGLVDRFWKAKPLTVWGNDYGFAMPFSTPASSLDDLPLEMPHPDLIDAPATAPPKDYEANIVRRVNSLQKYLLVSITNNSNIAVKDVRLMVNADRPTVYAIREKNKPVFAPTVGGDRIEVGTIDVGQQYTVQVWCSPATTQSEKVTVAYDGGSIDYHFHDQSSVLATTVFFVVGAVIMGVVTGLYGAKVYLEKKVVNDFIAAMTPERMDKILSPLVDKVHAQALAQAKEELAKEKPKPAIEMLD